VLRLKGVTLVGIVSLAFAAASLATSFPNGLTSVQGPITSLTPTALTVQANGAVPTTCTRPSSSPVGAGFKLGELVRIDCENGVLLDVAQAGLNLGLDITLIPGLPENSNVDARVPTPALSPTRSQCAAAWNATAPLASRQTIGAGAPLTAQVATMSVSAPVPGTRLVVQQTGHGVVVVSPVVTGPACVIDFALPGPRHAMAHGLWKDGTVPEWNGFIQHGSNYMDGPLFQVSANGTISSAG